ncbi:MAG: response regulator [Gammaproteobacteria bacterium]|jgi:two-component system response regulator BaeR|nr:response regulator [Gammaproteobacteria bacterium]
MSQHVLIVEDETKIASLLKDYLAQSGFETAVIHDGSEVEDWLENNSTSIMLLDLMLPGKTGIDICKDVRKDSSLPIIMITAKVEEIDRLLGLELGADDYICKPFSPREVVARVKTVLRRTETSENLSEKGLVLDQNTYKATIDGQNLNLTAVEFQLLKVLSDQPGRIFSRSVLVDKIYNDGRVVSDRTIDSHIKKLRKKIAEQLPDVELIHSLYAVGYKFEWQ